MFYHFFLQLQRYWSAFNVVHYVSFRAMAALLSSVFLSFIFTNTFIAISKKFFRSKARAWTPENHRKKDDMPTMGGLFILGVVALNSLLWCKLYKPQLWIFLFCIAGFGLIGWWDDWQKIKYKKGISSLHKFVLQLFFAAATSWLLYYYGLSTQICFPFFKWLNPDLGLFFILWATFIIVGVSNAVNLTDGLDGLAINSLFLNFATFGFICYLAGNTKIAAYLHIPYAGCSETTIIGTTLVGASLGFLWYNTYPAQIFMGDVGSLALGSALAFMALVSKQELLLIVSGGLFVIETLSVIVQILSYRYLGKRIFKMAPIHHHFELLGWQESQITVRFGIISLLLCLVALMTLKIR